MRRLSNRWFISAYLRTRPMTPGSRRIDDSPGLLLRSLPIVIKTLFLVCVIFKEDLKKLPVILPVDEK
ncbi:hypothetical protein FJU30_07085 [Affinibrenneria salicis]|uniref:Uncharacterized protein n=1 Tax=Affinibrenneria salicis TaxID=2590031 RepID=A0A5J5G6D9_9GAMM|nr:hypothetical protein [Affinibrenneria salicis]KAA9002036.1 hypothetical protein FJU30_07085 [Affinibrenneria salicis]